MHKNDWGVDKNLNDQVNIGNFLKFVGKIRPKFYQNLTLTWSFRFLSTPQSFYPPFVHYPHSWFYPHFVFYPNPTNYPKYMVEISRNMTEYVGISRNYPAIADVDFWQHGRHVSLYYSILKSERWISPIVIVMVSNKQYIVQLICKYVF
jgi:hypothetical protein